MGSRLDRITDWEDRARKTAYQVSRLARQAETSRQHLNRHFHARIGLSAHQWIDQLRMEDGLLLLRQGRPIKEIAQELGYQHATHFSRAIRRHFGANELMTLLRSHPSTARNVPKWSEMFQNGLGLLLLLPAPSELIVL